MIAQIRMRRDTSAAWNALNPILADGEPAVDSDVDQFKIGDGVTRWRDLPFSSINATVFQAQVAEVALATARAQAAADSAAAAAASVLGQGTSTDSAIASRINDSTSLTRAALRTAVPQITAKIQPTILDVGQTPPSPGVWLRRTS